MTAGFVEFEFDLPEALLARLIMVLDGLEGAPLLPVNLRDIPDAQGVYMLCLKGQPVYIGKTDGEAGLRKRLDRHAWTIQHRNGLSAADVTFRAVRIFVFTAMDLETQLIRHYAPAWNNSGFGSNDPGRRRDETDLQPEGFDAQYPIDLDHPVATRVKPGDTARAVLAALRAELPYTLRVEAARPKSREPHPDLEGAKPAQPTIDTTRGMLTAVVVSLPKGWQATALAGRIILYREHRDYVFGTVIARS